VELRVSVFDLQVADVVLHDAVSSDATQPVKP
jgi:hypothetical protein